MFRNGKCGTLYHLSTNFIKCMGTKVKKWVYVVFFEQINTQVLVWWKEHPRLHIDHSHFPVCMSIVKTAFHKCRHGVCLGIWIMRLDIILQHITKSLTQIRRISHHTMILSREELRLCLKQLLTLTKKSAFHLNHFTLFRVDLKQWANGINILKLPHHRFAAPCTCRCYYIMFNSLQCNRIRHYRSTQITAMISTSLHRQCECSQLLASRVNVNTINIVDQDKRRYLTSLITLFLVHLTKEIERIYQYVTTTHTWVDELDVGYRMNIFRDGIFLFLWSRDIIRHILLQSTIGMECHPSAS